MPFSTARATIWPPVLYNHDVAKAYFGCVSETLEPYSAATPDFRDFTAQISLGIDKIINRRRVVNWAEDVDAQNRMRQDIEDYLFDLKQEKGLELTFEEIDRIMEDCLEIARARLQS